MTDIEVAAGLKQVIKPEIKTDNPVYLKAHEIVYGQGKIDLEVEEIKNLTQQLMDLRTHRFDDEDNYDQTLQTLMTCCDQGPPFSSEASAAQQVMMDTTKGRLYDMIAYLQDFKGLVTGEHPLGLNQPKSRKTELMERMYDESDFRTMEDSLLADAQDSTIFDFEDQKGVRSSTAEHPVPFYRLISDTIREMCRSDIPDIKYQGLLLAGEIIRRQKSRDQKSSGYCGVSFTFGDATTSKKNYQAMATISPADRFPDFSQMDSVGYVGEIFLDVDTFRLRGSFDRQRVLAHENNHLNAITQDEGQSYPTARGRVCNPQEAIRLETYAIAQDIGVWRHVQDGLFVTKTIPTERREEYSGQGWLMLPLADKITKKFKRDGDHLAAILLGHLHATQPGKHIPELVSMAENIIDRMETPDFSDYFPK